MSQRSFRPELKSTPLGSSMSACKVKSKQVSANNNISTNNKKASSTNGNKGNQPTYDIVTLYGFGGAWLANLRDG
eukprot:2979008-Amphidinium_carterae.2